MAKSDGALDILHFHDEPFVIDNSPLGLDVGKKHDRLTKPVDPTNPVEWLRSQTSLDSILILEKTPDGSKEFISDKLDLKHPVTISFEDGVRTLSLEFNSIDQMMSITSNFKLKKSGRRMKQDQGVERRIAGVRWHASGSGPKDHPVRFEPLSSIYVVLFKSDPTTDSQTDVGQPKRPARRVQKAKRPGQRGRRR